VPINAVKTLTTKAFVYILLTILTLLFFSFRLTHVPSGLTIDESAFAYNASLLSQTLHDENNRTLPVFVLSINGKDWRQPVTQYFIALIFKLFGVSLYTLKLSSVVIASVSCLLIFFLAKRLLGNPGSIFALVAFITTPIVLIQSHLALDNIMVIPFTIFWLIFLYMFEKSKKNRFLVLCALSLGIGFYSYKGMRSFVPVWSILTIFYLSLPFLHQRTLTSFKKVLMPVLFFSLSLSPFFLIIPFLEFKYAGAVLGQTATKIDSIYNFFYSYFSSFDPSFLFIKGDEILHHSTGSHGMFLLATLPFFLIGLFQSIQKKSFWTFITISFFVGPLLFGLPGSYHRASRLMALIPSFTLITAFGAYHLWENRKRFIVYFSVLSLLIGLNFLDFVSYYWFHYSEDTYAIFYHTNTDTAYKNLFEKSKENNLTPYVTSEIINGEKTDEGIQNAFYRSIYFPNYPGILYGPENSLPAHSILMTQNSAVQNFTKLNTDIKGYFFYINQ
jgi:hypothetical protein